MQAFNLSNTWTQLGPVIKALFDRDRAHSPAIGPYSLVQLAYQGKLVEQGIPSQRALVQAHRDGSISANQLVECAAQAKLISASALTDSVYLNAVETGFLLHYSL